MAFLEYEDIYFELQEALDKSGVYIDLGSDGAPTFFQGEMDRFSGTKEEFLKYVETNAKNWFRVLTDWPRWIQGPEWQYGKSKPMVFAGQVDIPALSGWFHDDVSFFVFYDLETGAMETVSQIA